MRFRQIARRVEDVIQNVAGIASQWTSPTLRWLAWNERKRRIELGREAEWKQAAEREQAAEQVLLHMKDHVKRYAAESSASLRRWLT